MKTKGTDKLVSTSILYSPLPLLLPPGCRSSLLPPPPPWPPPLLLLPASRLLPPWLVPLPDPTIGGILIFDFRFLGIQSSARSFQRGGLSVRDTGQIHIGRNFLCLIYKIFKVTFLKKSKLRKILRWGLSVQAQLKKKYSYFSD